MGEESKMVGPLFTTRVAKSRTAYKIFASSMLASTCLIWIYRVTHMPSIGGDQEQEDEVVDKKWWVWIGLFLVEIWFSAYWILTQSVRWSPIYHSTFKDRLSQRYEEDELPNVDVFVCTADPTIEPPSMVISTVLSVMAYDYPPSKLSVYLSDDGCSIFTFYALIEASNFAKHWLPFCHKYKVEPRSPDAYFSTVHHKPTDNNMAHEWLQIKGLFEEMVKRIDDAMRLGRVPNEMKKLHNGFQEWSSNVKPNNHQPIVKVIIIDGRKREYDDDNVNEEVIHLPTLVYLSREKSPYHHHHFKAGAMNALLRVSSEISNGEFLLNVDCDSFSSNSASVKDALCFFLDKERGHQIGFVQYPQFYYNCTENDLYASSFKAINQIELPGIDGQGGPLYIGSGCFHRREALCRVKYSQKGSEELRKVDQLLRKGQTIKVLEERAKSLATCTFEDNTLWGREIGLKYGCAVEDVITGMSIQCKGWRSVGFNPIPQGFSGLAPVSLGQSLVQNQRWGEGNLQIFLSKHCSFVYGHGKIKLGLQMSYSIYNLWAANSFPTLYHITIPSLALSRGIPLYPRVSSVWFLPFAYVIIAKYLYSLGESLSSGDTLIGWWNIQRMWVLKRITSYLFATIDVILNKLGFSKTKFVVTSKVADDEVLLRFKEEIMDFSATPPAFTTIIATIALLNLSCFIVGVKGVVMEKRIDVEELFLQFCLSAVVVLLNLPVYKAMLFRRDNGRIPMGIGLISLVLVGLVLSLPMF